MDIFDQYPHLMDSDFVEGFDFSTCWSCENPTLPPSEYDVAIALLRAGGNYTNAAKLLGRPRRHIDRAISNSMALFDLAWDIEGEFLDAVEQTYRSVALTGDGQAARFFLSTKGKDRGYSQRSEVSGANGQPVQTVVQYQLPDNGRDP